MCDWLKYSNLKPNKHQRFNQEQKLKLRSHKAGGNKNRRRVWQRLFRVSFSCPCSSGFLLRTCVLCWKSAAQRALAASFGPNAIYSLAFLSGGWNMTRDQRGFDGTKGNINKEPPFLSLTRPLAHKRGQTFSERAVRAGVCQQTAKLLHNSCTVPN